MGQTRARSRRTGGGGGKGEIKKGIPHQNKGSAIRRGSAKRLEDRGEAGNDANPNKVRPGTRGKRQKGDVNGGKSHEEKTRSGTGVPVNKGGTRGGAQSEIRLGKKNGSKEKRKEGWPV